jgi:hypothetical protein
MDEQGFDSKSGPDRRAFCDKYKLDANVIYNIVSGRKNLGLGVQAELFVKTGDIRFQPTDKDEEQWVAQTRAKLAGKSLPSMPTPEKGLARERRNSALTERFNRAFRDFVYELCPEWESKKNIRLSFAAHFHLDEGSVYHVMRGDRNFGPSMQACLYVQTRDPRFAPTDDLERGWVVEWKKKLGMSVLPSDLPPPNEFALNDKLLELMTRYNIGGRNGAMSIEAFYRHLCLQRRQFEAIRDKTSVIEPATKIKIYLAFDDDDFAPGNEQENALLEVWQTNISRLPFVADSLASPPSSSKNIQPEPSEQPPAASFPSVIPDINGEHSRPEPVSPKPETPAPVSMATNLDDLKNALLADHKFLEKIAKLLSTKILSETFSSIPTNKPEPSLMAEILTATEAFRAVLEKLLAAEAADSDVIIQILEPETAAIADQLIDVLITVRALHKTKSAKLALSFRESERKFLQRFKEGET